MAVHQRTRNNGDDEASGERYIYSDKISIQVGIGEATNLNGWNTVQGSVPLLDPREVGIWKSPVQMCQVAAGHKWCSCCGDVRPLSYFDPTAWDERGKAIDWDMKGKPTKWDGKRFPTAYSPECKMCVNGRDPKLRPMLFCSCCKLDKRRNEFGDDERNASGKKSICAECDKVDAHERRRRKAEAEGRALRGYQFRTA